jgi:hypothetical protein
MIGFPKPPKRVINTLFYDKVRQRDGACLYGLWHQDGCFGMLHVHHIEYRGRGGDDIPDNAIVLCQKHHEMVHMEEISTEELWRLRKVYDFK